MLCHQGAEWAHKAVVGMHECIARRRPPEAPVGSALPPRADAPQAPARLQDTTGQGNTHL